METSDKTICILPYINLSKSLIMDSFEIHVYDTYDFSQELNEAEKINLDLFADSFRNTFFQKWVSPEKVGWIWVLKYKGSIIRTDENSEDIDDKIKILYLLLKLHVNHDFSNPWMNQIDYKTFDIFSFNVKNDQTVKFGNWSTCDQVYTTIPEYVNGLKNVIIYPLHFCINDIDTSLKMVSGFEDIIWVDKAKIDVTYLYQWITQDNDYYQKFLNLSWVHYWLEQQNDLFFYYAIIPPILEVLLYPISWGKKKTAVKFWETLDKIIIRDNDYIETSSSSITKERWLIARTISLIYDLRNDLLHEWKRVFEKLKVEFKWHDLRIYDVFQLIFKYSILNELIERWIIKNEFVKIDIEWNIFTTWEIKFTTSRETLYMDIQLDNLIKKASNDEKYWL